MAPEWGSRPLRGQSAEGRHESPVAELDRHEADRLRKRALELVAELDGIKAAGTDDIWRWAGAASVILKELARG